MKTIKLLLLFTVFFSCSKESEQISIPETYEIDINEDSIFDFEITYRIFDLSNERIDSFNNRLIDKTLSSNISGKGINSIFLELDSGIRGIPKLQKGDSIDVSNIESFLLDNNYSPNLIFLNHYKDPDEWSETWIHKDREIDCENIFVIVELENENTFDLCWMNLNLNLKNGTVELLDKNCTKTNVIIVGE